MTGSAGRRRPRVSATVDRDLLAAVDAHVARHPELDRSAVIDEALRLWRARQLEQALQAQFSQTDDTDPAEREDWDALRKVAAARRLTTRTP